MVMEPQAMAGGRETRRSFVPIAPGNGVPIEDIADAAAHVNSKMSPGRCTGT
jgi:hypothetical protein